MAELNVTFHLVQEEIPYEDSLQIHPLDTGLVIPGYTDNRLVLLVLYLRSTGEFVAYPQGFPARETVISKKSGFVSFKVSDNIVKSGIHVALHPKRGPVCRYRVGLRNEVKIDMGPILAAVQPPAPVRAVKATECPICLDELNNRTTVVCPTDKRTGATEFHVGCCVKCAVKNPNFCGTCGGSEGLAILAYINSGRPLPKSGIIRISGVQD